MEAPDFFVDDLLNLPNGDEMMADAFFDNSPAENSTDSSTVTPVDSSNSSLSHAADTTFPFSDHHFSGELCVPYDDLAELEWLSNFVEESFSSEDLHRHHQHHQTRPEPESAILRPDGPVPGKARSKLSRVAPSDWSTRLLMVSPTSSSTVNHHHHQVGLFPKKPAKKRAENSDDSSTNGEAVRRCLHCAAEKTPQWRTGPMGPKTLCNACGVRYKSGRLVPEYRPAASPTFVSAKHSNSHRKVLELRRQREAIQRQHQHHQLGPAFIGGGDEYMIHHHHHDYRQLI